MLKNQTSAYAKNNTLVLIKIANIGNRTDGTSQPSTQNILSIPWDI